jgi:RecA-family ATPase
MADIQPLRDDIGSTEPFVDPSWTRLVPIADLAPWADTPAPARQWLLDSWIPLSQATYLTGPGSAGKSLLAQQLCTCVSLGLPFMGVATRQTRAMYLSCEDDLAELQRRQEAICAALKVRMSDLPGRLHLVSLAGHIGTELATFASGQSSPDESGDTQPIIRPTARFHALSGTAVAHDIGFIALDNVAHLYAGNENIRNEVAAFVSLLNRLAVSCSGSVLLIGHPNKAGDSFSGSTAWENQVRSRLFLEIATTPDGDIMDPDVRALRREKSNYARNGAELTFRWHDWAFVRDEDLPEGLASRLAETAQASADNAIFLACLAERNRQSRPVSERPSVSYAPKVFAAMPESCGIGKARLQSAMDRLFRLGTIERAVLGRDRAKGRDIEGLRVAE